MKKAILFLALLALAVPASAGVLKGAASDVKVAAQVASFPVRHPVKTEHAAVKGVRGFVGGVVAVVKGVSKF